MSAPLSRRTVVHAGAAAGDDDAGGDHFLHAAAAQFARRITVVGDQAVGEMQALGEVELITQRNAAMVEAWCPPSEKESGVTLTMPMTLGRSRSMEKREVCQIMNSLKNHR